MKQLAKHLVSRMGELTVLRSGEKALANAKRNQPFVRLTVSDLAVAAHSEGERSAIVIAAGPSLQRRNPAKQILESGYDGDLIVVDGALGYCLRNGLVPDYLVTLDPLSTRVCRWFGDPELGSRQDDDDYFRRQDLDAHLGTNEWQRNLELIELVNRNGPSMKAVICTSSTTEVTKRCIESGMELYWWNPLMDDVARPDSMTRTLYQLNHVPCMVSGGNVGTAAWVVATQVLGRREVALVGMDLGYPPGTPLEKTQYYPELVELFGERMQEAIISVENPYLQEIWFADPAYYWYRECFLQLAAQTDSVTYNCTEGGILFGAAVRWLPLSKFLAARCGVGA